LTTVWLESDDQQKTESVAQQEGRGVSTEQGVKWNLHTQFIYFLALQICWLHCTIITWVRAIKESWIKHDEL
jgi:hypothetical protein